MPFSAKSFSRLRGTASVKLRLNIINSRQSIRASPLTPCPRIRTSASIASAPLISTLFGSLPPGGTSPAEGTVIYQCDRPPCSTHSRARRLRGSAGADDHEIVGFHEVVPSKSLVIVGCVHRAIESDHKQDDRHRCQPRAAGG